MNTKCIELKKDYTQFSSKNRPHRKVWEENYGPIPKGLLVCHLCDNMKCINIEHLFLGTQADNMKDMALKGRSWNITLSEKQVVEMRKMWKEGGVKQRDLARIFNISQTGIRYILNGTNRKYIKFDGYSGKRPPGNSLLTLAQIKEMRDKYQNGSKLSDLSEEYSIGKTTVWRAIRGKR